ncbi:hypothetical protein LEQ04_08580 [Riemerella anatipestifer]|uniref:hypothetical protein n=1 Tax=Riemerella anatipestifer TaxID=34085 RepID=UPI00129D3F46|nr:hypothetical protein [Riemerella anatipestifer]MDY3317763.1 hypothetical protein [Riemerella anatipestifer]MRM84532.1 hypothetical protein [Riemerella anatipestifer]WPC10762.1 hypothetical protein LEQ05_12980 [Riemerella anatipestifer]WPC13589.1 hypothetical protein LEQ03_02690 [Riemerella anatipestifer]WPC14635.1 hypothetical protein LEQ04_08580 [Riemerella anatipestifer]
MKVQIKIDQDTLQLLNQLMGNYGLFSKTLPDNRTGQSIMIELREILFKKGLSVFTNETKKPSKITFRYHTAEALCFWIKCIQENFTIGPYENSKLELLKETLYQNLL